MIEAKTLDASRTRTIQTIQTVLLRDLADEPFSSWRLNAELYLAGIYAGESGGIYEEESEERRARREAAWEWYRANTVEE